MNLKITLSEIEYNVEDAALVKEEEISKIASSMAEQGLLQAITVQKVDEKYKLIFGLKRLLSAKKLKWESIDVEVREITYEDEPELLRIHENVKRANLQWYEEAELVARFHELQLKRLGQKRRGPGKPRKEEGKVWGLRETAEELGLALGDVSQLINLADHVRTNPSLKNIKDEDTARKLIRREKARVEKELEILYNPSEVKDDILLGNAVEVLQHFEPNLFDACITDPPWIEFAADTSLQSDDQTLPVFKEVYRVLKHDSFLYAFVGLKDLNLYQQELPKFGFQVSKTPLIWYKRGAITRRMIRSWEYSRDFEFIVLAVKGTPTLTVGRDLSSVFDMPIVPPPQLKHPNEKPVALIKSIINHCTYEGSTILDPFAGSGAHLVAASKSGRRFVGIERDKDFYDQIRKRLSELEGSAK